MKLYKITIVIIAGLLFAGNVNAQDVNVSNTVNKVITNYLALKDALITSDGNVAEYKAKDLLASINAVNVKQLNNAQATLWNTYEPKLEFDSRHISEVNLVAHQREHFASLSNNLYTVLKAFKLNKVVLYRQYCLMNKKYFISDAATGKDPYMAMEHCSRVADTLPVGK